MKIGLVCPYDIAKSGGVLEVVRATRDELRKRGHNVYIITPKPQGHEASKDDHIIFVGSSTDFNSPLHTTVQISASLNEAIDTMLAKEKFDILHFHEPWVPMLGLQLLSRSRAVNVATFHAAIPNTVMSRSLVKVVGPYTKAALKYIDAFTATSDASAQYVSSLTDEPVAIIPNGVDTSRYKTPNVFDDKRSHKTIFYVGRLEGRKGVKYLLRAFKLLQERKPDTSLIIGGDGPERQKLEMLAQDLELHKVSFLGYISDVEKIKHMQTSDLFCAPSPYGESFGLVLVEAMGCGIVTIAGDNPGYASVMKGLGALSLVDPKESPEFARRLELLLYEPDLRKLWRAWAKSELPNYTYEQVVDEYEEVYNLALQQHTPHDG